MTNFYEDFVIKSSPTGSSFTCNPPVTNTDIDTVILAKPGYAQYLVELGWVCGQDYPHAAFMSWRKDNKNYIVTCDPDFYKKFVKATRCAKILNLTDKAARVQLFDLVLYDNWNKTVAAVEILNFGNPTSLDEVPV